MIGSKNWPSVRLEELCEHITVGHVGPMVNEYQESGIPFLRSQNVRPFRFDPTELKFISPDFHYRLKKSALRPGDVVVTRSGANAGQCCMIPQQLSLANCSDLVIFRPAERINSWFLMYLLNSEWGRATIAGGVVGAAQHHFNIGTAKQVAIRLPPLSVQRRIAGILSAYDDLIENCQRRIRILEEMAHALYREWFVDFRFPGHEKHPRVASPHGEIPEDWVVSPCSDLADYVNGYAFKPDHWGKEGKPIIKIRELKAGVTADTPRNSGDEISGKYDVQDGDVLFSWSADLDAYLWMGGDGLLNQHLFNVIPFDGFTRAFCFHALKGAMPRFRALSLGATMHHIKRSALDQVCVVVPPEPLRKRFERTVEPIHQQLITFAKQVQNLRRTRDLLLPRLLSGQANLKADDTASCEGEIAESPYSDQLSGDLTLCAAEDSAPCHVNGNAAFAEYTSEEAPISIDQIDRTEIMRVIRQVFSDGLARPRDEAIRDVARALGYRRTGARIQEALNKDMLTAVRRCILVNVNGELRLLFRSISDFDRDFLKQQFLAAIGRSWIDRDDAIRDFCRWFGFARTGPIIDESARSLINGLLREGRLEADGGTLIRRV